MSVTLRLGPALLRELRKIAARTGRNVSKLAEEALRQYVRSHRETVHLTSSKANLKRMRSARAQIETEVARRRRKAS